MAHRSADIGCRPPSRLKPILLSRQVRPLLVDDCAALVAAEVAAQKGPTGMLIKAAYKAFQSIQPGIVAKAVNYLWEDVASVLDRQWQEWLATGPDRGPFEAFMARRSEGVADELLALADARMATAKRESLRALYARLRRFARPRVARAVPRLASVITDRVGPETDPPVKGPSGSPCP